MNIRALATTIIDRVHPNIIRIIDHAVLDAVMVESITAQRNKLIDIAESEIIEEMKSHAIYMLVTHVTGAATPDDWHAEVSVAAGTSQSVIEMRKGFPSDRIPERGDTLVVLPPQVVRVIENPRIFVPGECN